MCKKLVLQQPNFNKTFYLQMDAFVKATVGLKESLWELLTKQLSESIFKKDILKISDLGSPDFPTRCLPQQG